jgi:anti-sigma regulatory factor (Ser/Thr protein kinase)
MTAHALPEPTGPVQLLDAEHGVAFPGSGEVPQQETWPSAEDRETGRLVVLTTEAEDVRRVRHLAQDFLARQRLSASACEDALLIISELVTNAVTHALPPAVLRLCCAQCSTLRIEVEDGGSQPHRPQRPEPPEEHGRGMFIVAALATRHGTVTHTRGVTRWAELRP